VGGPRSGLVCGQPVRVAIRQESIRLEHPDADVGGPNRYAATVVFHAFAGHAHHYVVQLADGRELEISAPAAMPPLARGSRTRVMWSPDDVIVLPGGTS
jgi:ABC-type Fe3+/spermidine/putrescine transport system ATPase subunit